MSSLHNGVFYFPACISIENQKTFIGKTFLLNKYCFQNTLSGSLVVFETVIKMTFISIPEITN